MVSKATEAVVIGAGIVGSSITHYLSEKGVGVTLLDKGSIAGGATGKATAVIRMHYTNPWDSAMAKIGGDVYSNWGDLIGGESGFVNSGFVFIVGEGEEEKLRANVDILREEAGINTYALDPDVPTGTPARMVRGRRRRCRLRARQRIRRPPFRCDGFRAAGTGVGSGGVAGRRSVEDCRGGGPGDGGRD